MIIINIFFKIIIIVNDLKINFLFVVFFFFFFKFYCFYFKLNLKLIINFNLQKK